MLGIEAVRNLSSTEVVVLEEGDAVLFAPGLVSFLDDLEVGEIIIVTGGFRNDISFLFSTLKQRALTPGVVECHFGVSLAFSGCPGRLVQTISIACGLGTIFAIWGFVYLAITGPEV